MIQDQQRESELVGEKEQIIFGGTIESRYENGIPKEGLCGRLKTGEPIPPTGINRKDVIFFLDSEGKWRWGNPDQKLLEEFKKWRGK